MFESQTQQQLQQVNALVERVLSSIEELREVIAQYQETRPITPNNE